MKKDDILKMLEPFEGSDHIAFDDVVSIYSPRRICGKGQYAMPYVCVLEPDRDSCFAKGRWVDD